MTCAPVPPDTAVAPAPLLSIPRTLATPLVHLPGVASPTLRRRQGAPYNQAMLQALHDMLAPAAMERLTLLINHVLRREPVAVERLLPHAGRSLRVEPEGGPAWLPPLPVLAFRVTPAGLLEWCGSEVDLAPDLRLRVPGADPARLALQALSGRSPEVQVEGDARFAADASWLVENLRWDIADDVERLLGPAVAQALLPVLGAARAGLVRAAAAAQALTTRFAPTAPR